MTNNTQKSATECREALCTLCGSETLPCKCKYLANVPHRAMVTIPKFEYAKLLAAHADTMRLPLSEQELVTLLNEKCGYKGDDWLPVIRCLAPYLSQHTGG